MMESYVYAHDFCIQLLAASLDPTSDIENNAYVSAVFVCLIYVMDNRHVGVFSRLIILSRKLRAASEDFQVRIIDTQIRRHAFYAF